MLERSQSLLQYYYNIANLQDWYSADHGSTTPLQDEGDELLMDLVMVLQTRYEHRDPKKTQRPDVITENRSTETDSCQRRS